MKLPPISDTNAKIKPHGAQGLKRATIPEASFIRTGAMLAIFLHHLWKGIAEPAGTDTSGIVLEFVFEKAALGVVFFNFLSGFLLALPTLGPGRKPFPGYGHFLRTRFLRIVPPYYLAVLLVIFANILIFRVELAGSALTLLEHLLFVQSWDYSLLFTNYAAYWYVGLIAQFYLLFPFILRFFQWAGAGKAVLSLCVVCYGGCWLLGVYVQIHPESILGAPAARIYFNLPARLPEFAMGMWLAAAWRADESTRLPFGRSFLAFFILALLFAIAGIPFYPASSEPLSLMLEVAWCFVFFIAFFLWDGAARWGSIGAVRNFAAASYGFYLLHQPLLSYAGAWLGGHLPRTAEFFFLTLLLVPVAYGAALLLDRAAGRLTPSEPRPS